MLKALAFFGILALFIVAFVIFRDTPQKTVETREPTSNSKVASIPEKESKQEEYVFVPYWTLDKDLENSESKLVYFGVSANKSGINKEEDGYLKIKDFLGYSRDKEKYLTVRMLDSDTNLEVFKDKNLKKKIIEDSVSIAKENGFLGIVLDLEMQGLPFESLITSISNLNDSFVAESHRNNLLFGTLIYGDTFYRARPFNVQAISKNADKVFVMAYDFSKSRGDPGPNFPFSGKEKYGYDFKTMAEDFTKVVTKDKLTILIGMFGYDWNVDEKNRGKGQATSKSTLGFEKFITTCASQDKCEVESDPSTSETKVVYSNGEEKHEIWFENNDSSQKKIEYLKSKGLNSVGYWAYGYY